MEESLDSLIDKGVYVVAGIDDEGMPLYELDVEQAKIHAPEVYEADRNACLVALLDAVEAGYLEIDVDPNTLETTFVVTEKGEGII